MRAEGSPNARVRARDAVMRLSAGLGLDAGARFLAAQRGASVRVMVLHGTPARDAEAFAAQVRWARERFALIDPHEYLEILDGRRRPPSRPAVVFTFDDGLASNAEVAAPVLEAAGTRGVFFVCPAFAELSGEPARDFFGGRVRVLDDPTRFAADDFAPMSPATFRALRERGHVIGNHTRTHQNLGSLAGYDVSAEVRSARDTLANWLGAGVDCFAWTFAWNAITAESWAAAMDAHRYCFTPCPGLGALGPACVWRTNVEADWPSHVYPFFYSGLADPIWWRRRRRVAALYDRARALRYRQ